MQPTAPPPVAAWVRRNPRRPWVRLRTGTRDECQAALDRWIAEQRVQSADSYIGANDPNAQRRI